MIEVLNGAEFMSGLELDERDLLSALERELAADASEIAARFRSDDLSGRKPDDTGLNRISGKLHASVAGKTEAVDGAIEAIVYNEGAPYWYYHEVGAGFNPKRLDWYNRFATEGTDLFSEALDRASEEAFA